MPLLDSSTKHSHPPYSSCHNLYDLQYFASVRNRLCTPPYSAAPVPNSPSPTHPSPPTPATSSIVVFHFGVRFNHPLGMFAPGAQQTLSHVTACTDLVVSKADEYGMFALSPWRAGERGCNNTLMMLYYFRDIEGLNRFAHDDIHRKAWTGFRRLITNILDSSTGVRGCQRGHGRVYM